MVSLYFQCFFLTSLDKWNKSVFALPHHNGFNSIYSCLFTTNFRKLGFFVNYNRTFSTNVNNYRQHTNDSITTSTHETDRTNRITRRHIWIWTDQSGLTYASCGLCSSYHGHGRLTDKFLLTRLKTFNHQTDVDFRSGCHRNVNHSYR